LREAFRRHPSRRVNCMKKRTFVVLGLFVMLLVSCGSDSSSGSETTQDTESQPVTEVVETYPLNEFGQPDVPKEVVASWPAKFCSLAIGMSRDEVRAIMGEPTSSFSDSSANQDEWDGYEISVSAFYDINDKVQQLDDSTGTSNLPCESSRKG